MGRQAVSFLKISQLFGAAALFHMGESAFEREVRIFLAAAFGRGSICQNF